jgi:hypothetical protein
VTTDESKRVDELECEVAELAAAYSSLICDFGTAERAATRYIPKRGFVKSHACLWCGVKAPLLAEIKHTGNCPFVRPRRCVSMLGHRWRLASDRERDNVIGTGGTWDLQYICARKHCSSMVFLFYREREAWELENGAHMGEPWPPKSERTAEFERQQWEAM